MKTKVLVEIFSSIVTALLFLLVYSGWTSPLDPFYHYDSSAFFTIGKCITDGYAPHLDLFDHKGPLLYVIYAVGWLIYPGKAGLFFLQVCNLTFFIFFNYRFFRNYIPRYQSYFAVIVVLFLLGGGLVGEGGLTEEWSLVFCVYPLFVVLNQFKCSSSAAGFSWSSWLILGLCLGANLMLRPNNAGVVCGLLIALGFCLVAEKKWAVLIRVIALVFLGLLIVVIPLLLFLSGRNALGACIDSYLRFNFEYARISTSSNDSDCAIITHLSRYLILGVAMDVVVILVYIRCVAQRKAAFCLFIAISCVLCAVSVGNGYRHYYNLIVALVPLLVWAASKLQFGAWANQSQRMVAYVLLSLCAMPYIVGALSSPLRCVYRLLFPVLDTPYTRQVFKILPDAVYDKIYSRSLIPARDTPYHLFCQSAKTRIPEGSSLLAINAWPDVYLYTGRNPSYRFFFLQEQLARSRSTITSSLYDYLCSADSPVWLIIPTNDQGIPRINDSRILGCVMSQYVRVIESQEFAPDFKMALYQRIAR